MSVIDQDKLLERIRQHSIYTFPHSIILCGEEGSGRHSLCQEVASSLGIELREIAGKINYDFILDEFVDSQPHLLIFAGDTLQERDQNTILKLVEEPGENIFILILVECLDILLPTIRNRCQVWNLEGYSKSTLRKFLSQEEEEPILSLAKTPGQVKKFQELPLQDMIELAVKMADNLDIASLPNTLTITDKLGFKDEKNKFEYKDFSKVLLYVFTERVKSSSNLKYIKGVECTSRYIRTWKRYPRLDMKELFEHFLVTLWREMRDCGIKRS